MEFQFVKFIVFFCIFQQCIFVVNGMLRPGVVPQKGEVSDEDTDTSQKSGEVTADPPHFDGLQNVMTTSSDLKYLGCYDTWKSRFRGYTTTNFYQGLTLVQCANHCRDNNGHAKSEIFVVRGLFCGCLEWQTDGYRLAEKACHLGCPSEPDHRTCGGNHASSLYCNQLTSENCRNFTSTKIDEKEPESDSESQSDESSDEYVEIQALEIALSCFNCTNPSKCYTDSLNVNLTYIPQNTPNMCVNFCGAHWDYYAQKEDRMSQREPTKYANVGWTFRGGFQVATCGCRDELPPYATVPESQCDSPCPANPEEKCGGSAPYLFTLYKTGWEEGGSGGDTVSTTQAITTEISTVEMSSVSTVQSTTVSVTTEKYTTHSPETSTTEPPFSTITTEGSTEGATTEATAVTSKTPVDKAPTANPCLPKCEAKDKHGQYWRECAGELANQTCPRQAPGYATWKCSTSGSFLGSPDYSKCTTPWIKEIGDMIGDEQVEPTEAGAIFESINSRMKENPGEGKLGTYFGHEIHEIMGFVSRVFHQLTPGTEVDRFENLTVAAVVINENLLVNAHPWSELSHANRSFIGTKLMQMIESNGFNLTARVNTTAVPEYRKLFGTENPELIKISTGGQSKLLTGNESLRFPFKEDLSGGDGSHILLPDGWANYVQFGNSSSGGAELNFIGMSISAKIIRGIFPETSVSPELMNESSTLKRMNGKLMSFSLSQNENMISFPDNGVKIRFRHDREASTSGVKDLKRRRHDGEMRRAVLGSASCVFWDTTKLEWSSKGCKLVTSGRTATMCECSHLTSFAVLMDMHNYVGKDLALEILTLILCPISIVCLLATIIIFTMVRSTHGVRTTITKNLCMSLFVGNVLVLLILDRHYLNMSEGVCAGSAILVHYVFLTAFMWTGVQGYHLYKQMVHVFESGTSHMTIYRVIAFGVPLLIVGTTAVVAFMKDDHAYGGEMFCWLQENYIWAFLAPVAIICVGNVVVLVITLRAAYHVKSPTNKIQLRVQSSRTWIKGCLSISVLLGLTWLTGYFMLIDSIGSTIAAYVFTLLNASQGIFLFLFHCVLNEKVRSAAARKNIVLPSWFTSTGASPSSPSQSGEAKENRNNAETPNTSPMQRNGVKRRSGGKKVHKPVVVVSSVSSENTSNWSMKSASGSGNESTGSQINLIYSERRAPWRK